MAEVAGPLVWGSGPLVWGSGPLVWGSGPLVWAAGAVVLAALLDAAVAEPPHRLHPVAWFGRAIAPFDRDWDRPVLVGVAIAVGLPATAAAVVGSLAWGAATGHPAAGGLVAGLALFVTTSRRMLLDSAHSMVSLSEADLARSREELAALAGRDASALSPALVRSAAVESAAENLCDGLVAPLFAFAALAPVSVPLAAAGATWVKAVNTLDSMLGYPHKPVGTASARLDDAVMWLPARTAALLVAVTAGAPRAMSVPRPWSAAVPSPNSGWPMGALAIATNVRLEKPDSYVLNPDAALPSVERAERGVRVVSRASALAFVLAAGWLAALALSYRLPSSAPNASLLVEVVAWS